MAGATAGDWGGRNRSSIEEIVCRLDKLLQAVDEASGPDADASGVEPDMIYDARRTLKAEEERARLFGADMFPNPGWVILLHLFVSGAEGRQVNIAGACAAAGVPETVALRHIAVLVAAKLIRRQSHHSHQTATHLRLTPSGEEKLCGYFSRAPRDEGAAAA